MKGKQGIGPSGVISGGGGGTGGGGGGRVGNPIAEDPQRSAGRAAGPGRVCVCSTCGYEAMRVISQPCRERTCPKCGASSMMEMPEAPGVQI